LKTNTEALRKNIPSRLQYGVDYVEEIPYLRGAFMRAVIFANGVLTRPERLASYCSPEDLVIAADGGARHCAALNVSPHVVIGDMDSLSEEELKAFADSGAEILQYSPKKDQTDLELALGLAVERGAVDILVMGALGERWDMTLANVLLLAWPFLSGVSVRLVDADQEISLLKGGATLELSGHPGDTLSLIPVGKDAVGVTLTGLEYPLNDDTIVQGSTWGISNVFRDKKVSVTFKQGLLLIVVMHGQYDREP
jgi:thiamine pyrophosphokinase